MKRLRSKHDLLKRLDEDYTTRFQEIQYLLTAVRKSTGSQQAALARAILPMAYAHWEGFVKEGASCYLNYVTSKIRSNSKTCSQLNPALLSTWAWRLGIDPQSLSLSNFIEATAKVIWLPDAIPDLSIDTIPKEHGILDSLLLKKLCKILSIDFGCFALREKFIDIILAGKRHLVAHGILTPITLSELEQITKGTVDLLQVFKNELENLVARDAFLAA